MPDTSLGITYPDATGHPRIWEHMQVLAEDVDTLLSAPPLIARKTSNESVVSSTVLQPDDQLFVPVEANSAYAWTALIKWMGTITADFKFDLSLPSGGGHDSFAQTWMRDAAAPAQGTDQRMFSTADVLAIPGAGVLWSTSGRLTYCCGQLTTVSSGVAQIRWAQSTSDATATQVLTSSRMELTKL